MEKYLLVKYNGNWGDEFDVDLLWTTTKDEYEEWNKELSTKNINDEVEIYFGTNEFISFNSYEDIIRCIEISEITEDFYNTFVHLIGYSFGLINLEDLPEYFDESE